MEFVRGDLVEVCSLEDGFLGSYFAATVVDKLSEGSYRVQYKNLVTDDESEPLIEIISAEELRPMPPSSIQNGFRRLVAVDAFDNDGWWVGEITSRKGNLYSVYFRTTGDKLEYPFYRLRRHVDWVMENGILLKGEDFEFWMTKSLKSFCGSLCFREFFTYIALFLWVS